MRLYSRFASINNSKLWDIIAFASLLALKDTYMCQQVFAGGLIRATTMINSSLLILFLFLFFVFSYFQISYVECSTVEFLVVILRGRLFLLTPFVSFNGPPLAGAVTTDKPSESWIQEKMMSFTLSFKMQCVNAARGVKAHSLQ